MDADQEQTEQSRPNKVYRRANGTLQHGGRSTSVGDAEKQSAGNSLVLSQGQQPSLHAFFDLTTRDKALAEANTAAAEADAARSVAAVVDAAAVHECQSVQHGRVPGQDLVVEPGKEDFDIGVDSLFE